MATLKQKNGASIYLQTRAEDVIIELDGETYNLKEVLQAVLKDSVEQIDNERDSILYAGENYTVPQYVVGCGNIAVYLDGLKISSGDGSCSFTEIGDADTVSTTIQFNSDIQKDVQILVRIGR